MESGNTVEVIPLPGEYCWDNGRNKMNDSITLDPVQIIRHSKGKVFIRYRG